MTRRVPPRGLRATVTWAFAAGALCLSVLLAVGTYALSRHYLIEQRERSAQRQAFSNAAVVRQGLLAGDREVSEILGSVAPPPDSTILIRRGQDWYSSSLDVTSRDLPPGLRSTVEAGSAATSWTATTDPNAVVVGVPLPAADADYYEIAIVRELDRTLTTLRSALAVCAAITTIAGAVLGLVASRRLLAPLQEVTAAAARVSAGDLSTRLDQTDDPDLAALVGSFNSMVDALDDRIQRDSRFAADVSHELRTPLTTLITSVSVIRHSGALTPRATQAIELMSGELERFRQSLEDLLDLGSLEAGVAETDLTLVDLHPFMRRLLEADGRSASLLVGADDRSANAQEVGVLIDRRRMGRAFTNLFANADRHGGGLQRVRVIEHTEFADVHVEDDGPGVPPEEREHIFERFARAGSRGSHAGTGLGLSIVAETVRLHGGSAWCAESPGGGARFVVRIPLHHADGEDST
ncbi:ATP-binding protein [Nocardioides sp.]|uniref:ATP-binding protein n=1 Tax=Nocardioides sp. TaxID=35761 RepID=UPI003D12F911